MIIGTQLNELARFLAHGVSAPVLPFCSLSGWQQACWDRDKVPEWIDGRDFKIVIMHLNRDLIIGNDLAPRFAEISFPNPLLYVTCPGDWVPWVEDPFPRWDMRDSLKICNEWIERKTR